MSEDIKEILDRLEIVARKRTIEVREDGSKIETMPACLVDELRLNNYSAKILYDYITNLQNIIKEVREYIENTTYADITGLEKHSIKEFWFVKELLEILDKGDDKDE